MENKPKTSSYKRLKPYIKGFQIPFVLAIFGAIIFGPRVNWARRSVVLCLTSSLSYVTSAVFSGWNTVLNPHAKV